MTDDEFTNKLREKWDLHNKASTLIVRDTNPDVYINPELIEINSYLQGMLVTVAALIQEEALIIQPNFGTWLLEEIDKKLKRHRELMK